MVGEQRGMVGAAVTEKRHRLRRVVGMRELGELRGMVGLGGVGVLR